MGPAWFDFIWKAELHLRGLQQHARAFQEILNIQSKHFVNHSDSKMGSGSANNSTNVLPKGKYTLVGVDIDTTGRRLIDEIVQLAAYTPKSQYAQYIMPYMNLNPAARQRHQVRVITIGFYRMLKCMQTYKVVKSKSEVAALKDFLDWIESMQKNDPDSLGVILIYHEERKFVPYMILEAMKKYSMLDRFLETVKSFANGYALAKEKCASSVKYFSLRQLSKVLLNNDESQKEKEQFEGSASVRARLAFEIAHHLAKSEQQDLDPERDVENLLNVVYEYSSPISQELDELQIQNKNLERQNSFRPVFLQYFKTTLYHRVKAVKFRIILAENGHDLESLKAIWTEKRKEGLAEVIQAIQDLKPDEKNELIELLDCHFDPVKQPVKPVVKRSKRRNRRSLVADKNKENIKPRDNNQGSGDKNVPDSTVKTPIKKMQGNRSRNNSTSNKAALSSNL